MIIKQRMTFLTGLDYLGIIIFAITGALVAARKENDIVGFIVLGTVTGVGGGSLRDMLLDRNPVFWIEQPIYLYLCLATSCVMFFCARYISRYRIYIVWGDALGMALFTVVGTQIALGTGAPDAACIVMGMMTAIVGGIIRDVLSQTETLVMRKEIYATASFIGASSYVLLHAHQWFGQSLSLWIAVGITFILRAAAILFDLRLPGYKWLDGDTD